MSNRLAALEGSTGWRRLVKPKEGVVDEDELNWLVLLRGAVRAGWEEREYLMKLVLCAGKEQ